MLQGTVYIISAPSGTGKSSIINALLKNNFLSNIQLSISYTTRMMRPGEQNGKHYNFIDKYSFRKMIKNDVFIEYACVFGNYYGTSRKLVENKINNGVDLLLDIDWQGAQQIKKKISSVRTIFVLPPSKTELLRRLRLRDQDSKEKIEVRMSHAVSEIKHYTEYEYIIINDNFNDALKNLQSIIFTERLCIKYQVQKYANLIDKLLNK